MPSNKSIVTEPGEDGSGVETEPSLRENETCWKLCCRLVVSGVVRMKALDREVRVTHCWTWIWAAEGVKGGQRLAAYAHG